MLHISGHFLQVALLASASIVTAQCAADDADLDLWRRPLRLPRSATRQTLPRNIVIIGDSVGEGYYADITPAGRLASGWAGILTARLQLQYGDHGPGIITTYSTNYQWIVRGGAWTEMADLGPRQTGAYGLAPFSSVLAATGTGDAFTSSLSLSSPLVEADGFTIITANTSNSGECAYQVDGTGPVNTIPASNPATPVFVSTTISTDQFSDHFISIGPNGSLQRCYVAGIVPTVNNPGATVHNLSRSGASATAFASPHALLFLPLLRPDLVIVALGINDFGHGVPGDVYESSLARIVSTAQAYGAAVLVLSENPTTYPDSLTAIYREAASRVANRSGAAFLDIAAQWGDVTRASEAGLLYDTVHPTAAGHADIAALVFSELSAYITRSTER